MLRVRVPQLGAGGGGNAAIAGQAALTFTLTGALLGDGPLIGAASLTFTTAAEALGGGGADGATTLTFTTAGDLTGSGAEGELVGVTSLTFTTTGTLSGGGAEIAGQTTLTFTAVGTLAPPPLPVIGGGGPGNARGRQRTVYMVDDKVFDSPAAAARYLASVTVPEPAPDAPRATPKPKPRLAVQVAGEQATVAPAIPVTATAEYTRELVQAELIQARRALQRRQREVDDEERAAVFAVVQMLLEDGETVTFH